MKKIHRGSLSLIESVVVIMLLLILMTMAAVHWKNSTNNLAWNATAAQLNTVSQAATSYIHDNYSTLSKNVTAGKPVLISGQTLRDDGYLPPGFSLTNNANQTWELAVAVNPAFTSKMVAFVLSLNGTEIPFDGLRTISAYAGGMAGYVYSTNVAEGAYGGWKVTLTDYGLNGTTGHLAYYLSSDALGSSSDAGDRLYRYSVDGHPDLNQMKTAIDMNSNNLNNAGQVSAKTMTATGTITSQDLVANNTVNTNLLTANGITSNGNISAAGTVSAGTVSASGNISGSGTVTGGSVRSNGRLSTGEYLQLDKVATAGTACSPNGLVSRDSNGAILSCQSGVWIAASGAGFKAPPAQTISCSTSFNSYVKMTVYAKVDEQGQVFTRMDTDSDISTDWVKGSTEGDADVTIGGLTGHGSYSTCSSGNHCTETETSCFAAWKW
ncbi:shufflon system plasmid conjugative transfer pilus tip adhesin PilV [Klebsiella aerogenes]|uniref:shufflon system plasmid conjugative transfer pilus tip adhesin PilV n=1 Tax=Klebsiella aerogenes TaxID=548 RepID=UPI000666582F|nr:shufflon system plasmid conjugative transfer pilus tip adhesin PilV [Klebsiella aerogenes]